MSNIKVGAIIQARMSSTRLPNKVLMPIPFPNGRPLLGHIIDQLKKAKFVDQIVIATSTDHRNEAIATFSKEQGITCFRGDEENVFQRFHRICEAENLDVVVRLTGDNPILDYQLLDETIIYHIENGFDYTSTSGLPLGMNFEVIDGKELLKIDDKDLNTSEKEHVTIVFRNGDYKIGNLSFADPVLSNLRLTIDFPEDAALSFALYNAFNEPEYQNLTPLMKIKKIQEHHPWLFSINRNQFQKRVFKDLSEELTTAIEILQKLELSNCAEMLKDILKHGNTPMHRGTHEKK